MGQPRLYIGSFKQVMATMHPIFILIQFQDTKNSRSRTIILKTKYVLSFYFDLPFVFWSVRTRNLIQHLILKREICISPSYPSFCLLAFFIILRHISKCWYFWVDLLELGCIPFKGYFSQSKQNKLPNYQFPL